MHGIGSYEEGEEFVKTYDLRLLRRLVGYIGPYKLLVLSAAFLSLAGIGLQLALPYLTKVAIDKYIRPLPPKTSSLHRLEVYATKSPSSPTQELSTKPPTLHPKASGQGQALPLHSTKTNTQDLRRVDLDGVKRIAGIYLLCLIGMLGFTFGMIYLMAWVGQSVIRDIRVDTFSKLERLKISFFDHNPVGRLVTRLTNDGEALSQFFTEVIVSVFADAFVLIGVIAIMLRLNVQLSLITFIIIPPLIFITNLFRIKVRKVYRLMRKWLAKINTSLNENITGIKVVKLFNRERENYRRFSDINHQYYGSSMRQVVTHGVFRPLIELSLSCGIALIIWWGGRGVMQEAISLGTLVAFLAYIQMFFNPIRDISERFDILQSSMAACERIFRLLDTKELEPYEPYGSYEPMGPKFEGAKEKLIGDIEFKRVWFSYEEVMGGGAPINRDNWVLKDVSFKVNSGERVAIVGPTGAGKTSLINLLAKFYEPTKGEISIDGVPIHRLPNPYLRSMMAIVAQENFIFGGSVRDNIRLMNYRIPESTIKQSAKLVNAHQFIERFPESYDEPIKENGANLSSGERQLLAFARALAFKPKILILDEAMREVDPETEGLIRDAIGKLLQGRTSIIIAHRLSTIRDVDRIIVLHKGKVIEQGTHKELLSKGGFYTNLYKLQYR